MKSTRERMARETTLSAIRITSASVAKCSGWRIKKMEVELESEEEAAFDGRDFQSTKDALGFFDTTEGKTAVVDIQNRGHDVMLERLKALIGSRAWFRFPLRQLARVVGTLAVLRYFDVPAHRFKDSLQRAIDEIEASRGCTTSSRR